jgi:tetratricopeptide (TPR) repeat protein
MKPSKWLSALALLALIVSPAFSKDTWTSVQSKNFYLVGNASEKDIRNVAVRLEQFRDVFSRLFNKANLTSPVPTTVIVFKDDNSYKPFKSNPTDAGYFQPGKDVNYITLTAARYNDQPFRVIFHEYVHQIVNNSMAEPPLWFNEGLAEYYSTFEVEDNQKAYLGRLISNHLAYLRQEKMLPLKTLFEVGHDSPYYNEGQKRSVFYAQSWLLVHYLMLGANGQRLPQLTRFLELLAAGSPNEKAFTQAFQTNFETIEKELKSYLQLRTFPGQRATFQNKLEFDTDMSATALTEAESQAYLGDLLVHVRSFDAAEKYLNKALALDPNLSFANASLGIMRSWQGKVPEARVALEKAVAGNSANYLTHYYYAFAMSREGMNDGGFVLGYSDELAAAMRKELQRSIELAPDYAEAYNLLAFVNMVRNEQLDESIQLLKHGLSLAAGRHDMKMTLAQLYMRKQDFKSVRAVLEPLVAGAPEPEVRSEAKSLLDRVNEYENQLTDFKRMQEMAAKGERETDPAVESSDRPRLKRRGDAQDDSEAEPELELNMARPNFLKPGEGELQVHGQLVSIECGSKGVYLLLNEGQRVMRFLTGRFEQVKFITYTMSLNGEITCGPRKPANNVIMTYRALSGKGPKADGEVVAVEFLPDGMK